MMSEKLPVTHLENIWGSLVVRLTDSAIVWFPDERIQRRQKHLHAEFQARGTGFEIK